jgi:hypothetical protein
VCCQPSRLRIKQRSWILQLHNGSSMHWEGLTRINVHCRVQSRGSARPTREVVAERGANRHAGRIDGRCARLSRAYRANLSALALVALFTAGSSSLTQTLAILRRRRVGVVACARRDPSPAPFTRSLKQRWLDSRVRVEASRSVRDGATRWPTEPTWGRLFLRQRAWVHVRPVEVGVHCVGHVRCIAGAAYPALQTARIATATSLKPAM